jgi:hypothetical protein
LQFKSQVAGLVSPFGTGNTSLLILNTIKDALAAGNINPGKGFYDL